MTDCDLIGAGLNLLKTELNYRLIGNRIPCLAFQFEKKKKKKKLHKELQHKQTNKINHIKDNSDHLWCFIEKTLSKFYVNGITVW